MMERTTTKPKAVNHRTTLWSYVLELLKNPWYSASLLLVALLSFGYYITNFTIGVDTLSGERYVSGEMLAQGRMTWTLVGRLLRLYDHQPFFDAVFGVCLILILATLLCAFFRLVTKGRISVYACMAFGGLFVSYPLVTEAMQYPSLIFFSNGGGLMAFGALYALYRASTKAQLIKSYIIATVLLVLVTSLYESLLVCYIFLVFAYLLLTLRYLQEPATFKQLLLKALRYMLPLIIAVVLEALISNALIGWLDLKQTGVPANSILWGQQSIRTILKSIAYGFVDRVIIHSLYYLPMGIMVGAMGVMFVYGVVNVVRHKPRLLLFLCYAVLFFCLILLSFIQATSSPYRTLQVFTYFVALTGLLLVQSTLETERKSLCCVLAIFMAFLVYHQAGETNRWFVLSHRNYEQEQVVISRIGTTLQTNFDIDEKPVVFVGDYQMADNITREIFVTDPYTVAMLNRLSDVIAQPPADSYKKAGTSVYDVLGWSAVAFGSNDEIIKYFDYFGYTLKPGTKEQLKEAKTHIAELPAWPQEGSICDMGDYIIVNFGE